MDLSILEELMDLGYDRDLALKSVKASSGDVRKAVQYCYENNNSSFPPSILGRSDEDEGKVVFGALTPKTEYDHKYEYEIEVLLGRQKVLKDQLSSKRANRNTL